jgi:twinkle protein
MSSEEWKSYTERVKRGLAANIGAVCAEFLDRGKRVSGFWHVGSPNNDAGDSLKVHLVGEHAGSGYFNREERGIGPLDLFMEANGISDFKEGLRAAGEWLKIDPPNGGGGRSAAAAEVPKKFGRMGPSSMARDLMEDAARADTPPVRQDWKPIEEGSRAWKYLVEERRITPEALRRARVGEGRVWMPMAGGPTDVWVVPVYDASGAVLLNAKYMALDRPDGKKDIRAAKGADYHLIGMHLIEPGSGPVVLCEGEPDWLSCLSEGLAAVAVPFGAKADGEDGRENAGNRWINNDWEWLTKLSEMVLGLDADKAGEGATTTLLRRLPEGMVKRVIRLKDYLPEGGKDLNDVYQADPLNLHLAVENAVEQVPGNLARVRDFRDQIFRKMFRSEEDGNGYEVHGLGNQFRWRMAEWSIVSGYEGSGKTTWLGHQIVDLVSQGAKACIASLENQPWQTYEVMFSQALGVRRPVLMPSLEPDVKRFDECVRWMDGRVFAYSNVGFTVLEDVLELFAYCARRHGCRFFVIDSLMMLQRNLKPGQTNLDREAEMAQMLKLFCDRFDSHIFLVAHAKKVQDEKTQYRKPVRPQDVKGAGDLVNLCFNLVTIYMNDEKLYKIRDLYEAKRQVQAGSGAGGYSGAQAAAEVSMDAEIRKWEAVHDSVFYVLKQRNSEGDHPKPARRLWFLNGCRQLWHDKGALAKVYVPKG